MHKHSFSLLALHVASQRVKVEGRTRELIWQFWLKEKPNRGTFSINICWFELSCVCERESETQSVSVSCTVSTVHVQVWSHRWKPTGGGLRGKCCSLLLPPLLLERVAGKLHSLLLQLFYLVPHLMFRNLISLYSNFECKMFFDFVEIYNRDKKNNNL